MKVSEAIQRITKLKEDIALIAQGLRNGDVLFIEGSPMNVFEMVQFKSRLEDELKRIENLEVNNA